MQDAPVVQMVQGQDNLGNIKRRRPLPEDALPPQPQKQLAAAQEVHDNEDLLPRLEAAPHVDDEGVVALGQYVPLGLDVFDVRGLAPEQTLANDLHGKDLARRLVAALQYLAEGAHADHLEQLKVLGGRPSSSGCCCCRCGCACSCRRWGGCAQLVQQLLPGFFHICIVRRLRFSSCDQ